MIRHIVAPDPGRTAFAVCRGPRNPSLATRDPAAFTWRQRQIAPGLGGLARSLPRHDEIEILPSGWRPAVPDAIGVPVWHPGRPLLAGLAIRDGHLRPWIADLESREVTVFGQVRAAVSLAGPVCPLAWSSGGLLFLTPSQADPGAGELEPLIFEAHGPAFVTFEEPAEAVLPHAGVRLARLDTATGKVSVLTGSLLVRALTPSPSGRLTLIEAGDEPEWHVLDAGGALIPVPATRPPRWCHGGRDVLAWREPSGAITVQGSSPACELPGGHFVAGCGQYALPAGTIVLDAAVDGTVIALACRSADGRAGLARIDGPESALAWTSDARLAVRAWASRTGLAVEYADAIGRYRLDDGQLRPVASYAVGSPPAPRRASTRGSGMPLLLWIRPRRAEALDGVAEPSVADASLDAPVTAMDLDLPLHWPSDATASYLTNQVTSAVERAVETAATRHAEEHNGRVVIAGFSFGATLALLAMSRLPRLAAAIAVSGCYNRTLVPTGFQYEHRSYWQVPDVYHAFSPLLFADQLDRPVLLLHGAEDDNPNTSPTQAVELYKAIIATGGHARLVLFPAEGHSFRYAETLNTSRSEQLNWLTHATDGVRLAGAAG